jgi:hypothetical protein
MSRKFTTKLYDMLSEGLLTEGAVVDACLAWMSEDEVREMMEANEFVVEEEEEESNEDSDDGQPSEYAEWQDYLGGDDWDHGQYD